MTRLCAPSVEGGDSEILECKVNINTFRLDILVKSQRAVVLGTALKQIWFRVTGFLTFAKGRPPSSAPHYDSGYVCQLDSYSILEES